MAPSSLSIPRLRSISAYLYTRAPHTAARSVSRSAPRASTMSTVGTLVPLAPQDAARWPRCAGPGAPFVVLWCASSLLHIHHAAEPEAGKACPVPRRQRPAAARASRQERGGSDPNSYHRDINVLPDCTVCGKSRVNAYLKRSVSIEAVWFHVSTHNEVRTVRRK